MWPYPYERDKARLKNTINYVLTRPWKYLCVIFINTPVAWFGHSMYLSKTDDGFQKYVLTSDNKIIAAITFARQHPIAVIDRAIGMVIALAVFISSVIGIITAKNKGYRIWIIIGIISYYFAVTPFIGVLSRYSIPAYVFMPPFIANFLQNITLRKTKVQFSGEQG